ncbi:interferon-inducible GTPase 5-like [Chanos chanos]|uniref:Interferon-inducible GTPase 5-like n=1 Tax=Chanos chanos TaxID=29144 RepID=A0A6J2WY35_CHACN|nr:interferon-inducible GTPase 5-like [Chanos chanos]
MAETANKKIDQAELQKMKRELEGKNLPEAVQKIKNLLEEQDHVELNIAVTGESGSGKSSFINAFRGIGDDEENSAKTGVVETTMEPKAYPHPKYTNVKLWDLPGIGTENFKASQYLETVGFQKYDFFIIVASARFRECHAQLASEMIKMKKKFYFVRSQIDNSIKCEKRKKGFDQNKTLNDIRADCQKGLQKFALSSTHIFLISSFEPELYDFGHLQETLASELSEQKRHVLMLALPNVTSGIIEKKKEELEANIWKVALLSAGAAAVPVPGLSIAVDVGILVKEIERYTTAFSFDEESLKRASARSGRSLEEIREVLKSPLMKGMSIHALVMMLLGSAVLVAEETAERVLSFIPILGSLAAGTLSFVTVRHMLQKCLNEMAEDAETLLKMTFETAV